MRIPAVIAAAVLAAVSGPVVTKALALQRAARLPRPRPSPPQRRPKGKPGSARIMPSGNQQLTFTSTSKVNQILGQFDKQQRRLTLSKTFTRYGIRGTDLGQSFEDHGRRTFLFGDTVGTLGKALDTIANTDSRDPDAGVKLDFLTSPGQPYLTIQPPGVNMGAFNVPVAGIDVGGKTYVVVKTGHSAKGPPTDKTLLLSWTKPAVFHVIRQISKLPGGRFIKMSMQLQPAGIEGLPIPIDNLRPDPYILIWGTGVYRGSDPYFAIVPQSNFESGAGTLYFSGLGSTGLPQWSPDESHAASMFTNGRMGDISVTWCAELKLWLMTYDNPGEIDFRYAANPWGPWSDPQKIFDINTDGYGRFIHFKDKQDGLQGPIIGKGKSPMSFSGGCYAPYVVDRWTSVSSSTLSIYYTMSTWNPYVAVLMKSQFTVAGPRRDPLPPIRRAPKAR